MDLSDIAVEQPVPIQPSAIDVTDHPEIFSLYSKEAIIKLAAKVPLVKLYWSRSKWDKLTETQRVVCSTAWRSIDDETKSAWDKEIEAAKAPKISAVLSTDPLCNPNTNIHDKARLLHLLRDPAYASTWSLAHHVMNRSELDDKQSPPQHWNKLAAAFNDYDGVTYRNATITYSSEGAEWSVTQSIPQAKIDQKGTENGLRRLSEHSKGTGPRFMSVTAIKAVIRMQRTLTQSSQNFTPETAYLCTHLLCSRMMMEWWI